MNIVAAAAKHAIQDKLESQIKSAEAKLDTLKARAEVPKADFEIKTIAKLATRKLEIHEKLLDLKKAGDEQWEHAKKDLETRVAAFERSIKEVEAKVRAH